MSFTDEHLIPLAEAAAHCPGAPSPASLWRWCSKGMNGVHLEHRRYGRRIYTSIEALNRFASRLAEVSRVGRALRLPSLRGATGECAVLAAEKELANDGL